MSAITVVLGWEPAILRLVSVDATGAMPWLTSGFLPDPDGINDSLDDGDAVFTALALPGSPPWIPDSDVLVTTLLFEALAPSASSPIDIVAQQGEFGRTQVFDSEVPNLDVVGSITGTSVAVVPCQEPDVDGDGDTDLFDFALFQSCFTGEPATASPICDCLFNDDDDDDIDLLDYSAFNLSGPTK